MNRRAFLALIRREVRRGRRLLIVLTAVTGGTLVLALLGGEAATAIAVALAGVSAFLAVMGPSGDLGSDKLLGHLEADRVLPVSTRLTAAGRLVGASIRLLPAGIAGLTVAVVIAREIEAGLVEPLLFFALPIGALVLASVASWSLLALNARWKFRNLWWLPLTIFLGPQIAGSMLPAPVKAQLARSLAAVGRSLLAFAMTPAGAIASVSTLLLLPIAVFIGATLLFASGLERYRFDANVLDDVLGKAPRRELGAIGRGPLLAVTRLRLRLSLEQQRRNAIFLLILLAVVLVGSEELRGFARTYIQVVAVMLPAGIALQLTSARGTGHLEGMQQLPHSARTVALGHLAAIAILAAPGAAVILLGRLVDGRMPGITEGITVWGWLVMGAWIAAVLAVWFKPRYLAIGAAALTAALFGWYALAGGAGMGQDLRTLLAGFRSLRGSAGVALPIAAATLVAVLGIPLFKRGLETYVLGGK